MKLLTPAVLSLAAAAAALLGGAQPANALATTALDSCSGQVILQYHADGGPGGVIAAVANNKGGYTVTISCPACVGGVFAGFVINPSTGTLKAQTAGAAASCNGGAALQHTSADPKTSLAFDWTGTGTPTFNAVFVGTDAGAYQRASVTPGGGASAAAPSASAAAPKATASTKPSATPKASTTVVKPSASAAAAKPSTAAGGKAGQSPAAKATPSSSPSSTPSAAPSVASAGSGVGAGSSTTAASAAGSSGTGSTAPAGTGASAAAATATTTTTTKASDAQHGSVASLATSAIAALSLAVVALL